MNVSLFRTLCGVSLAALPLAVPAVSQAQSGYTIIDIGSLGAWAPVPRSINNSGQIVGESLLADGVTYHGFLYSNGVISDLGALGKERSAASAINDSGQIAGFVGSSDTSSPTAIVWTATGANPLLGLNGGFSQAYGINNQGQVTGGATLGYSYVTHAVLWTGTTPTDLGSLGGTFSIGLAVNDSGQVAGYSTLADNTTTHAFRYANGVMTDLPTLGGPRNRGSAINASGQVAGLSFLKGNAAYHAVVWNGTTATDLGSFYGGNSEALGMNSYGDIVGYSFEVNNGGAALLYTGGRLIDLNTVLPPNSGWQVLTAWGINDSGWITGIGKHNGVAAAFLLKPNQNTAFGSLGLDGVGDAYNASTTVPLDTFHLSFRAPGTTDEIYGADLTLTALAKKNYGTFAVSNIPPGHYDIALKGTRSLRVVLPNVTVTARTFLPIIMPIVGDANNDNRVDSADFGLLVNAYGGDASDPNSGYDPTCDFNYDGVVDTADFGLLVGNYGAVGDL